MAEPSTFIKLHRSLLEHELWKDKPFSRGQAWVDLLMMANYADEKRVVGNDVVFYPRGSIPRSMLSLAERWGWSRKRVKAFLGMLERNGMVTTKVTTHGTTVTVANYEKFQGRGTTKGTTKEHQKHNGGSNEGNNARTQYKNIKNIKEDKEYGRALDVRPAKEYPAAWHRLAKEKGMTIEEYERWRNQ